jgi:hypothetical protein
MYNDKKWNKNNMKECDKWKSHIRSKLHMIYISTNNGKHPVTETFTSLHYTSPSYTSLYSTPLHLSTFHFLSFKLHPTTLHYTSLPSHWTWTHLNFLPLRFTSLHITTLHLTSLLCNFRRFSTHFYFFHFTPFIFAFLTLFLNILGLKEKVPNASAGI